MRGAVAPGGSTPLGGDEPLTPPEQRERVRTACALLAQLAHDNELVISHGNRPAGPPAPQRSDDVAVEGRPLDLLGAQAEGMIGYVLHQDLTNELPFGRPVATLLAQVE